MSILGATKFFSNPNYKHGSADKVGVLLVNLGTPEAPTADALRPYLKEFLSDPRVVEIPRLIWWPILNLIILNVRPKKSAEKYLSVWTEQGSPLMVNSLGQLAGLKRKLKGRNEKIVVELAMRYGKPSINSAILKMMEQDVDKLLILPLYPQYSGSTTATVFDKVFESISKLRNPPSIRLRKSFHDHPDYIVAVANDIEKFWLKNGKPEHLLFSFHGVPVRSLQDGDPYHCQCHKTARMVSEKLALKESQWTISFQSRFGKAEWLKPYTTSTIVNLAEEKNIRKLHVICPGFISDCLETLEEINMEAREDFLNAGGSSFKYIPCLNFSENSINLLHMLVKDEIEGWDRRGLKDEEKEKELSFQRKKALLLGAKI